MASTESHLTRLWKENTPEAHDQLFNACLGRFRDLVRVMKGKASNPMLQTDLVIAEAVLKMKQQESKRGDIDNFTAVMTCAVRQVLVDYARRYKHRRVEPLDGVAEEAAINSRLPGPPEHAAFFELAGVIRDHLGQLTAAQAQVLRLRLFGPEDCERGETEEVWMLELDDVATRLGRSYDSVWRAWKRGTAHLRGLLARLAAEDMTEDAT